jgi:predicted RNA binding protein YcfA (HicA-like mRNA interferase family)
VSGRQTIRVLTEAGFRIVGRKGSHIRLKKKDGRTLIVIVPDHKELARGTLNSILR